MFEHLGVQEALNMAKSHISEEAALTVIPQWIAGTTDKNYAKTEEWVNGLPAGKLKDKSIERLVSLSPLPGYDLQGTMTLVEGMSDEKLRESAEDRLMRQWATSHPETALKWLKNNSWSTGKKEEWIARIGNMNTPFIK